MTASSAEPARAVIPPATSSSTGIGGAWRVGVVLVVALLTLLFSGNPLYAMQVVMYATIAWTVVKVPLRWSLVGLVSLAIFADMTPIDPTTNKLYESIARPVQELLLENLNKLLDIEALKFSGMEVALLLLAFIALIRTLSSQSVDQKNRVPSARILKFAFMASLAAALGLEVLGALRGGDIRQSFWQARQLFWMPVLGLLFGYALRGARDLRVLLGALTLVSSLKIAVGAYFVFAVARPAAVVPATATSHMDTVLFVSVLALWAAVVVDRPTLLRILTASLVWAWTFVGLVLNNRRTALVSLVITLFLLFVTLTQRTRRRIMWGVAAAMPFLAVYLRLGKNRTGGVFKVAAQFWSVFLQKDSSSITRDIENFNLVVTLKQHLIAGSGWGHEYVELMKGDDISAAFPQYRYIAHNSVLWLLSIGGWIGFTLMWMPIVVGIYLAARAQRNARSHAERVGAYAALAITTCYLLQAWSDMGVTSWTTSAMLACSLVVAGKVAVANGGWPHRDVDIAYSPTV